MLAVYYYVSFVAFSLYVFPSFFVSLYFFFFFFNDPASPEIYTLSLHDALPIWLDVAGGYPASHVQRCLPPGSPTKPDRKSTRLNSSHRCISYAVFCLKKKKQEQIQPTDIDTQQARPQQIEQPSHKPSQPYHTY